MEPRGRLARGVWIAAGSATALLLALSGRYGFHRDELYFLIAGRNLDWGFVDQPPLTPLVARISELIGGTNPIALRVLPALAVGSIAIMAAAICRRFGGGQRAQIFAGVTAGFTGVVLGEGHLLSTAIFDFALWTAALLLIVQLLDGGTRTLWVLLGVVVGIGLENKHTMAFLALALLLALAFDRQRRMLLTTPWPWLGVAIAMVIALPNLIWQWSHGFPQLEMARAISDRSDGALAFVLFQPLLLSVTLAIPAAVGLWRLARSDHMRTWRPIAITYAVLFVVFLVTGAKAYYIAPLYPALLAAGAVWFEDLSMWARRLMTGLMGIGIAVGLLIALPVMPISSASTFDATGELGETVGWPELVDQVVEAYKSIPGDQRGRTAIFTSSYGEAGAIDVLGSSQGLPASSSGHNNYWLWGPPDDHGPVIGIGQVDRALILICPDFETADIITNPYGVENEEFGLPIYICTHPKRQLADVWGELRHYN
ncbi:MAG: glycosyltransferase family 39 protein [Acidimicrobiia bacterium]